MTRLDSYHFYIGSAFYLKFCWALMTTVSMVFMVTVAELNPLQMVLVGTVLELSGFLFEIPTGVVADVYGRKLSLVIGYAMVGMGYMLLGLFPSFELILLSQVVWGAGYTFISGAEQAWITDEIGERAANKAFIVASQWGKVGLLCGIPVCIYLATINMKIPIILGSAGLVLLGLFAIFFMTETDFRGGTSKDEQEGHHPSWRELAITFKNGLQWVRSHPVILIISVIAVFEGLYSEGFDRLYAPFLIEAFEFPVIAGLDALLWWGIMSAGATVFALLALELVRRFLDTNDTRHLVIALTVSSALLVASMLFFILSGDFYLAILAYFAISMLRSVKAPLTDAWLNQNLASASRATVFSMQSQADAFGQIAGGPAVGLIGKYVSIKAALLAATFVLIPLVGLYHFALGISQKQNERNQSRRHG